MAGPALPTGSMGAHGDAWGLRALAPALRRVQWPPKFGPELPPRYDDTTDSMGFLQAYAAAMLAADGDDRVMGN